QKEHCRRESIDLDDLLAATNEEADQYRVSWPMQAEITLINIDDKAAVGLDTERLFIIEGPTFGKLVCAYSPGQATSGMLARNFISKKLLPKEMLLYLSYALKLIDQKIKQNLYDAMEGLIREVVFETFRELNGYAFIGDIKDKAWKTNIRKWHATA